MKKIIHIIISLLIIALNVKGQTISRQVIPSSGGYYSNGTGSLSWTLGETITPTLQSGSNILTQGFQQPESQLATGAVATTICSGSPVNVPYTAFDIFPGNTFTAQLSDASGSFTPPVIIGSLVSNVSGTISCLIPSITPSGGGYRIRVISSSPALIGTDNGADITINTSPVITCPANISVSNDANQCGAIVTFIATATGTPVPTIGYSHNPGSFFPVGITTVTATATNSCGSDVCTFTVTVTDNQLPVISCPGNINVSNTPGLCGATVNYTAPVASDNCTYSVSQTNGHPSGGSFPIGTTVNTFVVTDASGNTDTCSFQVTVTDTQAPYLATGSVCPSNITACNPVSWTAPVFIDNCPGVVVSTNHSPGTNFPIGTTLVTYTALDLSGLTNSCSFNVTVLDTSLAADSIGTNRDYNNICISGDITLTVKGGHLGEVSPGVPAQWKWYRGGCGTIAGGILVGTGTSITVTPNTTTTYFVRAEGGCHTTACLSKTVVVSSGIPASAPVYSVVPVQGAPGVTAPISVVPVPGASFYRWFTNNGQINGILFDGQLSPWETTAPTTNITFVLPQQNYQVRVLAGNACGRTNQANTHIRGTVEAPTSMNGPAQACPGNSVSYSITAIPSNSPVTYNWALVPPTAGTITPAVNGLSATVIFNAGFGTAQVCVNGISSFGLPGPAYCLTVSSSAPVPGVISGNQNPCSGNAIPETYSILPVQSAISYSWTCSVPGAIVVPAANGLSANISFPAGSFTGTVQVTASSSCGTSDPSILNVINGVPGDPGEINGASNGLCGAQNASFNVPTTNANYYLWTVTANMSVDGPANLNAVTIDFLPGFNTGIVTVEAFYNCGSTIKTHGVSGAATAPVIVPAALCANNAQTYFVTNVDPYSDYTWSTSGDILDEYCSIGSLTNCTGYYIETGPGGGTFAVTATNTCATAITNSDPCRIMAETFKVDVYPNPTTGLLTVEFYSKHESQYRITVTELSGRMVLEQDFKASSGHNQHELDLGFVNPGLYMIYVKDANGNITVSKIAKE